MSQRRKIEWYETDLRIFADKGVVYYSRPSPALGISIPQSPLSKTLPGAPQTSSRIPRPIKVCEAPSSSVKSRKWSTLCMQRCTPSPAPFENHSSSPARKTECSTGGSEIWVAVKQHLNRICFQHPITLLLQVPNPFPHPSNDDGIVLWEPPVIFPSYSKIGRVLD